jgi:hypothetical protein
MTTDILEEERKRQRIVNAYHRVFSTSDGQEVLDDIKRYFKTDRPNFILGSTSHTDAAIRDGQRQVVIRITDQLAKPVMGDADIEKPQTKVKK